MGPQRDHVFLLASILLFVKVALVSGTHFRYGTISWFPLQKGTDGCGDWPAGFEMQAAFRRNYDWGRWYKEEWQWGNTTNPTQWWNGGSSVYGGSVGGGSKEDKAGWIHFDGDPKDYESSFLLRFKTGMSAKGYDLAPSTGKGENVGGKLCDMAYHKGWDAADPVFPKGKLIPDGKAIDPMLMVCSPWNEGFGWFWGDGTREDGGVVFKVTNIDPRKSMLGNVLRATTLPFSHCYKRGSQDGANTPWTAYFTSGNRIHNLNNNADGRYRLEVQIRMTGDGNRSPRATQIPVLPVPYTDSPSHAHFQIAAFDPDIGDTLTYRLGSSREFGAIMAHRLADAQGNKYNTWFEDVYNEVLCGARMCSNADCSRKWVPTWCPGYNALVHDKPPTTWDQPAIPWDNATFMAGPPPDLDINYYTGFVTFRTGKDPWTPSTARADMRSFSAKNPGFWNLVVMIADEKHSGVTVPLDFLLYLYPPVKFCSVDCVNKKAGIATFDTFDGMYGDPSAADGTDLYVYNGPGTGFCSICGGGGLPVDSTGKTVTDFNLYQDYVNVAYQKDMVYNQSYCEIPTTPTGHPVETGSPNLTDSSGAGKKWPYMCRNHNMCTPTPMINKGTGKEIGKGSCMGIQDGTTVMPYINDMAICRINTKPRFVSPPTPPLGPEIKTGKYAGSWTPAKVYLYTCEVAKFRLQATDDDECVSLTIDTTGLYEGMALGDHHRVDPYTVWRDFTWPANCVNGVDPRPRLTMVCFYAFDYYLITADPFHCVEIHISDPPAPPNPPPPRPPPPSCQHACEVPWLNCPQVRNNTNYDCLDGVICPRGFWRCGADRENFYCYDPAQYSCVANEVVNGTGIDDVTAIMNCTARCLPQYTTCDFWDNCGVKNTDTTWCIDGVVVPAGKWRCGNAPYYPDLDACILGSDGTPIRVSKEYSYDLKFDGYGIGPCNDTVPLPAHHGCRKECPRKYLWQNCATPYLPGELECIDGRLCPPTTYLYRASDKLFGCLRPIAPNNDYDATVRGFEEATGLGPCTYMTPALDVKPHGDSPDTFTPVDTM